MSSNAGAVQPEVDTSKCSQLPQRLVQKPSSNDFWLQPTDDDNCPPQQVEVSDQTLNWDLHNQQIAEVDIQSLPPKISSWNLSGNLLQSVPTFNGSSSIKLLDLSRNPLRSVKGIDHYSALQNLQLREVPLTALDITQWPELLMQLLMPGTNIQHWGSLQKSRLQSLVLENASLTTLNDIPFPSTLKDLFLDKNPQLKIDSHRLPPSLTILGLRNNGLSSMQALNVTCSCPELKHLHLDHNDFEAFPQLECAQTSKIEEITMTDNRKMTIMANITLPPLLTSLTTAGSPIREIYGLEFDRLNSFNLSGSNLKVFEVPDGPTMTSLVRGLVRADTMTQQVCKNNVAGRENIHGYTVCIIPNSTFYDLYRPHEGAFLSNTPPVKQVRHGSSSLSYVILFVLFVGAFVLVLAAIWWKGSHRGSHSKHEDSDHGLTFEFSSLDSSLKTDGTHRGTEAGAWQDPALVAVRMPFEKLEFVTRIASGGNGQVFKGVYRSQTVAIKKLLPVKRQDATERSNFLMETKLMMRMEHANVIAFIGVAWKDVTDPCVVVEYMNRGDLRNLLTQYDRMGHPQGFTREKVQIAVDIANGLTYLHSMDPVVLHRDLKSRNVLLNDRLQAKLSDFGISRVYVDETMTAGIGTYLWMAPEVMLGRRYDAKADVFSFGVILSELDTHLSFSKVDGKDVRAALGIGQRVSKVSKMAAILRVAMAGSERVKFSDSTDKDLVALAHECLAVEPRERPTAAEASYRLSQLLKKQLL